jgi:hypothetical protein
MYMSLCTYRSVCQLEEHRVHDVEPRELVQGGRGQDDLSPVFQALPLVPGHHGDAVATVLSPERPRGAAVEAVGEEVHPAEHGATVGEDEGKGTGFTTQEARSSFRREMSEVTVEKR